MSKLHLLGIFHTVHNDDFSHCAFTGKAKRFPKMMRNKGWDVTVYANEGSGEDVTMLSAEEFNAHFGDRDEKSFFGDVAVIGSKAHQLFEQRLIPALRERVEKHDIICHPFGHVHSALVQMFPECFHVETGIGYPTLMDGSFKIFESYAWMHYHQGKAGRHGHNYEWVIPNYFDLDEWEPCFEAGYYLAFLGRICDIKGMDTIKAIAEHSPYPIHICGQGNPERWEHPNIIYKGPIKGRERSDFLRHARAILMPSVFVEPFGGAGVEALLCGTPLIAVDYGAFTETVNRGINGFRCHTLYDWLKGVREAGELDRRRIAADSRTLFGLESCGERYDNVFRTILDLTGRGWYEIGDEK